MWLQRAYFYFHTACFTFYFQTDFKKEKKNYKTLGAVRKRRPQSGEVDQMSSANILQTREVLQMRTSTFYRAKNCGFFEIYGVSKKEKFYFFDKCGRAGGGGGGGGEGMDVPLCLRSLLKPNILYH